MNESAFVSDFDGTITDVDVYALIAERYAPKNHPDYFAEYRAGRLTHFEAMQAFFHFAPSEPQAWDRLLRDTKPDPHLADCVRRLDANGWDLLIVSNGSSWYIEQILSESRRLRHYLLESRPSRGGPRTRASTSYRVAILLTASRHRQGSRRTLCPRAL